LRVKKTFVTDNTVNIKFSMVLDEFNYIEPKDLEVFEVESLIEHKEIGFFTETLIIIIRD